MNQAHAAGKRRRATICEEFHLTSHITRDYISFLFSNGGIDRSKPILAKYSVGVLNSYCEKLAAMMFELFDRKLAFRVTIKAIGAENAVFTIARDRNTRKSTDILADSESHPLTGNVEFQAMLARERTVWASDDLVALEKQELYRNTRENWKAFYNATMVVPVRKTFFKNEGAVFEGFELAGFLSVDCMRPENGPSIFTKERAPDEILRNLLLGYADVAYSIIKQGRVVAPSDDREGAVFDESNFGFIRELNREYAQNAAPDVSGSTQHQFG